MPTVDVAGVSASSDPDPHGSAVTAPTTETLRHAALVGHGDDDDRHGHQHQPRHDRTPLGRAEVGLLGDVAQSQREDLGVVAGPVLAWVRAALDGGALQIDRAPPAHTPLPGTQLAAAVERSAIAVSAVGRRHRRERGCQRRRCGTRLVGNVHADDVHRDLDRCDLAA